MKHQPPIQCLDAELGCKSKDFEGEQEKGGYRWTCRKCGATWVTTKEGKG